MSIELHNGDCLEVMATIESGSVDAIICDPPYGTVKGMGDSGTAKAKGYAAAQWDTVIDHAAMLEQCNRILRPNGALVLFSQDPYTAKLMTDTHGNLPFSYRYTWKKDHFSNCLSCKKAPVNYTEDVCVFRCKKDKDGNHDFDKSHPLRDWFYSRHKRAQTLGISWRDVLGNAMGGHYFTNGVQFCIPTEANYAKLQETGLFCRKYSAVKAIDTAHKDAVRAEREKYLADFAAKYPTVFNLPPDAKYKSNVLEYRKDYRGEHPTQKPVALMEDLVCTYTNEGDTVLDFTMGSGTTGDACVRRRRSFIGIERDEGYFAIAKERIAMAECPADEAQGRFEL